MKKIRIAFNEHSSIYNLIITKVEEYHLKYSTVEKTKFHLEALGFFITRKEIQKILNNSNK
jgi:hypothetical protein